MKEELPDKINKFLNNKKIIETTETPLDFVWWFKNPDDYIEPKTLTELLSNYYLHIGDKGPMCLVFNKDGNLKAKENH